MNTTNKANKANTTNKATKATEATEATEAHAIVPVVKAEHKGLEVRAYFSETEVLNAADDVLRYVASRIRELPDNEYRARMVVGHKAIVLALREPRTSTRALARLATWGT